MSYATTALFECLDGLDHFIFILRTELFTVLNLFVFSLLRMEHLILLDYKLQDLAHVKKRLMETSASDEKLDYRVDTMILVLLIQQDSALPLYAVRNRIVVSLCW